MIKKFLKVSRYDKPHGILFLYYPCIWGIFINKVNISEVIFLCICFLLGSCGMRSLGCIWNDYIDRDLDSKVARTRYRLISSRAVNNKEILFYFFLNSIIGVFPLFFIPQRALIISFLIIPIIIFYPFMKRITWYPQLYLGICFNWGMLVGYTAISNDAPTVEVIIFYIGSIFWTISYDTIYAFQDVRDDSKIGIKSTAVKFKSNAKIFIFICYLLTFILWIVSLFMQARPPSYIFMMLALLLFFSYRLNKINLNSEKSCLNLFKENSYCGLIISIYFILSQI